MNGRVLRPRLDWLSVIGLDLDPCYLSLAEKPLERRVRYKEFVGEGIEQGEQHFIRTAVERNQLTGSSRFIDEVEERLGERIEFRGRGRPKVRSEELVICNLVQ